MTQKTNKNINWHELTFDIVLICYASFFLLSVAGESGRFYESFSIVYLIITSIISTFFIIWYFGILYNIFRSYTTSIKILIFVGLVCLWIAVAQVFTLVKNIGWIYNLESDHGLIILGYSFIIIYGFLLGIFFAVTEVYNKSDNIKESRLLSRILFLRFFAGYFLFNAYISLLSIFSLNQKISISVIIAIVVTVIITGLIIFSFPFEKKLKKRLKSEKVFEGRTLVFFKHYILPIIIITSLCLVEEIYIWGKINSALVQEEIVSNAEMIFHLTISGILPMRLLFALHPPITGLGIIGGLASISYFIYRCVDLLQNIF